MTILTAHHHGGSHQKAYSKILLPGLLCVIYIWLKNCPSSFSQYSHIDLMISNVLTIMLCDAALEDNFGTAACKEYGKPFLYVCGALI